MVKLVVGPGEEDNVKFGKMMERWRTEARYSRKLAADAFGLSSEYIRLIENGQRVPALGSARLMLKEYDVDVERIHYRVLVIDDICVEFVSRVLKAHNAIEPELRPYRLKTRAKKIGRIVEHLIIADDETLDAVHDILMQPN